MEVELIVNPDKKKTFSSWEEGQRVFDNDSDSKLSAVGWVGFMCFYCRRGERLEINVLQTSFYFGFRAKMSMSTQLSRPQCPVCFVFLVSTFFLSWCSTCVHFLFYFEVVLILSHFALPALMRDLPLSLKCTLFVSPGAVRVSSLLVSALIRCTCVHLSPSLHLCRQAPDFPFSPPVSLLCVSSPAKPFVLWKRKKLLSICMK